MATLANYNDIEFSKKYHEFHGDNDNTLVCHNNILIYSGENVSFNNSISVQKNESFDLDLFRVVSLDNAIWKLDPAHLFLDIRESVKLYSYTKDDMMSSVFSTYKLLGKINPSDEEINYIYSFLDYYNALSSIKNELRDNLLDYYNSLNNLIEEAKKEENIKENNGFRVIYKKMFNDFQFVDEGSSNVNSYQRARVSESSSASHKALVSAINTTNNNDSKLFDNVALVNKLVIIYSVLVIGFILFIGFIIAHS